jgi:protein-S-isoprenylcysteine O-methyltransferase Ste14
VPVLVAPALPLVVWLLLGAWIDLLLMPACAPVVQLGARWWIGEAVGLLLCCPALLLARWTAQGRHLYPRTILQVVCFCGLLLGVLPAGVLALTGGTWQALLARPRWLTSLLLQAVALAALPGLSAVQEFATRGGGTPVPYDPPKHLVTSGVYAYLANPMQTTMSVVLCLWGAVLASPWVALAGLMAVAYSAGLAAWDEGGSLRARHGDAWTAYRARVRAWWPRSRPFVATPARLYVALGCDPCSALGRWIAAQAPIGLTIVAAEHHPTRALRRLTYDPGDGGAEEDGIAALGRALEHLHLGWAYLGWTLRLPGLREVAQVLADASGGGPRAVGTRA